MLEIIIVEDSKNIKENLIALIETQYKDAKIIAQSSTIKEVLIILLPLNPIYYYLILI